MDWTTVENKKLHLTLVTVTQALEQRKLCFALKYKTWANHFGSICPKQSSVYI